MLRLARRCLDEQHLVWALGLAASQPVGLRESFGSMNKSFNPGRAASNGLVAAILASRGFTSSDAMIEAKRGWANTISTKQDWREITGGLGQRWQATLNTYKPFACGVVLHPALDAALQLRNEQHLAPDQIARIALRVNPLVLELTGKKTPRTGLEGKFSVYHAVAVALVEGKAGERQFTDRAVGDHLVVALRSRVNPIVDPAVKPEQGDVIVELKDGRRVAKHIEKALGSVEVPMSDRAAARPAAWDEPPRCEPPDPAASHRARTGGGLDPAPRGSTLGPPRDLTPRPACGRKSARSSPCSALRTSRHG